MTKTETLKVVKASELDEAMKIKLRDFMARCEARGLYCQISEDQTRIVFFSDKEKKTFVQDVPISLYHTLHLANM